MSHPSESISAYLDGELGVSERADLIRHLSGCGRCSGELDELQRVRAAVRSLPVLELPVGLILEADPVVVPLRSHRGVWVGVAAAVVAVVIAVAALVTPDQGTATVDELMSRLGARDSLDLTFGPAKVVLPPVVGAE